jgi:hypothetical protein
MRRSTALSLATAALVCTAAKAASAQETDTMTRGRVPAPRRAFEIGVNTGYTQGFGRIDSERPIGNVADAGFTVGAQLGARVTPMMSVSATAAYNTFSPDARVGTTTDVHGMVLGAEATGHFLPSERVDPFITVGAGYRALWIVPPGTGDNTMIHGFQLARINAGFDIRATEDIAIGPFIGADVNLFVWNAPEGGPNTQLTNPVLNTYVYAGVQGKFDLGGTREMAVETRTGRR